MASSQDVTLFSPEAKPDHPHAALHQLPGAAGLAWWAEFLRRCKSAVARRAHEARLISWHPDVAMPFPLFSQLREATECYTLGRFLATISLASALVESVLNRDSRLATRGAVRRIEGWIWLNNPNLLAAGEAGLPVQELLEPGESVAAQAPVCFVALRSTITHADGDDFPSHQGECSAVLEGPARTQLDKAARFLVTWFNTCPDIQTASAVSTPAPTEAR